MDQELFLFDTDEAKEIHGSKRTKLNDNVDDGYHENNRSIYSFQGNSSLSVCASNFLDVLNFAGRESFLYSIFEYLSTCEQEVNDEKLSSETEGIRDGDTFRSIMSLARCSRYLYDKLARPDIIFKFKGKSSIQQRRWCMYLVFTCDPRRFAIPKEELRTLDRTCLLPSLMRMCTRSVFVPDCTAISKENSNSTDGTRREYRLFRELSTNQRIRYSNFDPRGFDILYQDAYERVKFFEDMDSKLDKSFVSIRDTERNDYDFISVRKIINHDRYPLYTHDTDRGEQVPNPYFDACTVEKLKFLRFDTNIPIEYDDDEKKKFALNVLSEATGDAGMYLHMAQYIWSEARMCHLLSAAACDSTDAINDTEWITDTSKHLDNHTTPPLKIQSENPKKSIL